MNGLLSQLGAWLWIIGIPILFLIVVVYVFRRGAREKYRRDANIPFEENNDRHK